MAAQFKALVTDGLVDRGIEILTSGGSITVDKRPGLKEDELIAIIGDYDALVVRSQTKVNAKVLAAAKKLKVVGRAGVGVDNVDVPAATARGIIVMNTPGGNTIATAELTFAMMMTLTRRIPQAHASMVSGKWDRKAFEGTELYGKTLGIIGMGRIGSEVARRAIAFGMRVVAFDPFLSLSRAKQMQVELIDKVHDLLPHADYITVHTPLTPETRNLLNRDTLALCKKGVRLINCARGGLINEADLAEALQSGQVAGAALDVYEAEPPADDLPLRKLSNVVLTPHLGASTAEAQESVGIEVAEQIRDYLTTGTVRNAVNAPSVDAKVLALLGPHLELASRLGKILAQLAPKRVDCLQITFWGKVYDEDTRPIARTVVKSFLENAGGNDVNQVNALSLAEHLGIRIETLKNSDEVNYTEMIKVRVRSAEGETSVCGTLFGNDPRLVEVNGNNVEVDPEGILFFMENTDRPGVVGWLGTIMGKHKINIASMSLSRKTPGGRALTVLNVDSEPTAAALDEIRQDKDILNVQVVRV
ncbi:phosphoglycerate dehydrogenase [Oscillatoria amoena NRMC-F 0135]|nr:phosphoglycerate dehydrogenase [Oscillatoria laete-virens]MDL5048633.1 phosphoglycerate dehydrogenase [Oscillatoria amoena NRMC-F 0135]MDL5053276.1 phosphoglycerate dehydrogenase [Oscillatoria laete-virens NRMC-F 0139]